MANFREYERAVLLRIFNGDLDEIAASALLEDDKAVLRDALSKFVLYRGELLVLYEATVLREREERLAEKGHEGSKSLIFTDDCILDSIRGNQESIHEFGLDSVSIEELTDALHKAANDLKLFRSLFNGHWDGV